MDSLTNTKDFGSNESGLNTLFLSNMKISFSSLILLYIMECQLFC
ncbi:hypothetical protein JOD82_003705 [Paenibacillus sp. 1182]|nr:hypothetical protein [Paenibacillus sp. 1182]